MWRIAIDLIPLMPLGLNGGAKPMVLALLEHLPSQLPDSEIILLTAGYSHDELAFLEKSNMCRVCVLPRMQSGQANLNRVQFAPRSTINQLFSKSLPPSIVRKIRYSLRPSPPVLREISFDLYFCPFTAPHFHLPDTPMVSVVYDLQFLRYPDFFSPKEAFYRCQQFEDACFFSTHVIAISEYVRQIVLKTTLVDSGRISTIPIGLVRRFPKISENRKDEFLHQWGLHLRRFLLYPANFWPHKNHTRLLEAFKLFLSSHPGSDLKLVLPGDLKEGRFQTEKQVEQLGLVGKVLLPGFISTSELGILYASAQALVFPSLYEGFGIPLLEAMSNDLPILCSNVTSLPEVASEAALFFDPKSPRSIMDAIEALETNPVLRQSLIAQGKERLPLFGDAKRMAHDYARVLKMVLLDDKTRAK